MKRSKTPKAFFITATDTDMGKTTVTKLLMTEFIKRGFVTIGCKTIACGLNEAGLNDDVKEIEKLNSIKLTPDQVNPLCFKLPVSPNIAAEKASKNISVADLVQQLSKLSALPVDYIFYEGIGGWKVPLNERETLADMVQALQVPVIIIVGIRVGCLNHALLTFESISQQKIPVAGWIANIIDNQTPAITDHINTLRNWITAPYIGSIPFLPQPLTTNFSLDLEILL